MKEKENLYEPVVSFKKQTPKMLFDTVTEPTLYEKAYLAAEDKCQTEYAMNTTTWD